ncbi:MAG: XRE family transcriptional regulator [Bacteroidetes bacterium HGW-Bacteroidetes-4]|jgi:transcriptional regulator with XRE-family HTH domain|nr:MAG: XRE family transcriptional regulator [Bacteroidetes bacterium HGW-Bacteroidetes-4]
MKSVEFGAYLKAQREDKGIPQRIVAHALDVDTSTLSKMELGERQILISMIKPLADVLEIEFKDLQIKYITEKIISELGGQEYLKEALKIVEQKIQN